MVDVVTIKMKIITEINNPIKMKIKIKSLSFIDKLELAMANQDFKYVFTIGMAFEGFMEEHSKEITDGYLDYLNNKNKPEDVSFPVFCYRFFIKKTLDLHLEKEYGTYL